MRRWIRRILTKRHITVGTTAIRKVKVEEELPSGKLEALVVFAMVAVVVLAAVEVAHIAVLGSWNGEIFNATVALIGTVTGIIIGRKAKGEGVSNLR